MQINDYEATEPMTSTGTQVVIRMLEIPEKLSNDDVISTLNSLIETCKDGQEGI